jgi:hypothetical protein
MLRTVGNEISTISGKYVDKTFHEICAPQEIASEVTWAKPDISAKIVFSTALWAFLMMVFSGLIPSNSGLI